MEVFKIIRFISSFEQNKVFPIVLRIFLHSTLVTYSQPFFPKYFVDILYNNGYKGPDNTSSTSIITFLVYFQAIV
jgi:hypothetical protein